mmetsp:Transcript_64784/g.138779  ORF Transcript_64784/g.138779 Transcript_64784/m.138779 type:complete len:339 (+) Transcript_64784:1138-2154(+)
MALGGAGVRAHEDHTAARIVAPIDRIDLETLRALSHDAHHADDREVVALVWIVRDEQAHQWVSADAIPVLREKVGDIDDAVQQPLLVCMAAETVIIALQRLLAHSRLHSQPLLGFVHVLLHISNKALHHESLLVALPEIPEPLATEGDPGVRPEHGTASGEGSTVGGDSRCNYVTVGSTPGCIGRTGAEAQDPPEAGVEDLAVHSRLALLVSLGDEGHSSLGQGLDAWGEGAVRADAQRLHGWQGNLEVVVYGKVGLGLLKDHVGGVQHLLVVRLPAPTPSGHVIIAARDSDAQVLLEEGDDVDRDDEGVLAHVHEAQQHLREVPLRAMVRELIEDAA